MVARMPPDRLMQRNNKVHRRPSWLLKASFGVCMATGFLIYPYSTAETDRFPRDFWGIEKKHVAATLFPEINANKLPERVKIDTGQQQYDAVLRYTLDPRINDYVHSLLKRYRPDYAAVVVIEPNTGRVLSIASNTRAEEPVGNLALHSGFPASSIFKIVTAAAAMEKGVANPTTQYRYNGKKISLYKKNILRHEDNKWTQKVSLSKAFAQSINTVFGKMGVFHVGGPALHHYASQFGFDKPWQLDLSIAPSETGFDNDDDWAIAQSASGFTRITTLSPLHAAMISSAIVNDGIMVEPYLVDFAHHPNGPILYTPKSTSSRAIDPETAKKMRVLMRATVKHGTARKSFREFFKGDYEKLDVGGKTGSLTGYDPKGKTEWFVGYGDSGKQKLAIAAVVVNKKKWYVKPSYLARKILEKYFEPTASG